MCKIKTAQYYLGLGDRTLACANVQSIERKFDMYRRQFSSFIYSYSLVHVYAPVCSLEFLVPFALFTFSYLAHGRLKNKVCCSGWKLILRVSAFEINFHIFAHHVLISMYLFSALHIRWHIASLLSRSGASTRPANQHT